MEVFVSIKGFSKQDCEDLKIEIIKEMRKGNAKFALKCMAYLLGAKACKEYVDIISRIYIIGL